MGVHELDLHRIEALPQSIDLGALASDGLLRPVSPGHSVRQQGYGLIGERNRRPAISICQISTLTFSVRAPLRDLCPLPQRVDLAGMGLTDGRERGREGGDITSVITGVITGAVPGRGSLRTASVTGTATRAVPSLPW